MTITLPTEPQTRHNLGPLQARVLLAGMPKCGKSTLLAGWAPKTTLIIDTQKGTTLLDGEHFVAHVANWKDFVSVVDQVAAGDHKFKTVGIDMIDDVWTFCDAAHAGKDKSLATATDDYGRSAKNAEGAFRATIGKLLATDLGIWFLSHTKTVEEGSLTRYVPKLDGKVLTYVAGAAQFVFLAEALGTKRVLHTQPSAKFEAGSRIVAMPEPLDLDARKLYAAMSAGLESKTKSTKKAEEANTPVAESDGEAK